MNNEDIFDQDRGERLEYELAEDDAKVLLPLTKDGFEALLERAAKIYNLPIDDSARNILAGYIHHVDREENTLLLSQLAKVLYKAVANATSWLIDQQAKQRRQDAQKMMAETASLKVPDENEKSVQH